MNCQYSGSIGVRRPFSVQRGLVKVTEALRLDPLLPLIEMQVGLVNQGAPVIGPSAR